MFLQQRKVLIISMQVCPINDSKLVDAYLVLTGYNLYAFFSIFRIIIIKWYGCKLDSFDKASNPIVWYNQPAVMVMFIGHLSLFRYE